MLNMCRDGRGKTDTGMDGKNKEMRKVKNGYIELCRFLFCVMIVIHHNAQDFETGTVFPSGFVAVEFFFFISGAMAMRHISKENGEISQKMRYAVDYTLKKIRRVFPYAACGTLIAYIWRIYSVRNFSADMVPELAVLPFELLFLPMGGIVSGRLDRFMNAPLWYVSAMLFTLPLIVYLCLKAEDAFKHYVVWFVPVLIHGWMILHMGGSWGWGETTPVGYSGLLVAFSNLTLGFGIYLAAGKLAAKNFGTFAKVLLTIAEAGGIVVCFLFAASEPEAYVFETVVGILAVSLTITLSGVSYTGKIHGKVFEWLGMLSLPIYCVHWWTGQMVQVYLYYCSYPVRILLILLGSTVLSVMMMAAFHIAGRTAKK